MVLDLNTWNHLCAKTKLALQSNNKNHLILQMNE